jgi:ribose/xylose/arabinose/galactoside ABC-type transport system permease subunit
MLQPTDSAPDAVDHTSPGLRWRDWRRLVPAWSGAALALVLLVVVTACQQETFLKLTNILNILEQSATVGIVAVGMTLVITMGGIDLSVGSLLALAGGLGILAMNHVFQKPLGGAAEPLQPVLIAAATTIGVGLVVGLFNGILVTKGRLAPFIATLAGLLMFRSAAGWIANGGQFFSAGRRGSRCSGKVLTSPGRTRVATCVASCRPSCPTRSSSGSSSRASARCC